MTTCLYSEERGLFQAGNGRQGRKWQPCWDWKIYWKNTPLPQRRTEEKVALAGAVSMMPEILILDEPFDGLDPKSKSEMIDMLNRLNGEKGITLVITTHDINIVPRIADLIYVINKGKIVTKGSPADVFAEVEMLREANLEPPILTDLFDRLAKKGYPLTAPASIDNALEQLEMILGGQVQDEERIVSG